MNSDTLNFNNKNDMLDWVTIQEAVRIVNKQKEIEITEGDIYRNALSGKIILSIYFQSSVLLRKIRVVDHKPRLHAIDNRTLHKLCLLEKNCFMKGRYLSISTEGKYFYPGQRIIDTPLLGYEYLLVQRLLAHTLNLPLPVAGIDTTNYGLIVTLSEGVFQLFEKITWNERVQKQVAKLPEDIALDITDIISASKAHQLYRTGYFPLHDLPSDACFVIRHSELDKLMGLYTGNKAVSSTSTRMSTPLSRLFWLACKHNEAISPLIRQPYKLLSIFEQWASDDGITDRLNGDTLKNALERGSPSSASLPH
ncbi:hypothetical protein [Citrobacter koseri]|uniref:hypothetical protein n=1 Tax=Citrobacter koseri TaxID=545 RepID=UPI0023B133A7|nr:hypothetical protein [Citrobacter koseri]